jgi:hypothetical protein
MHALHVYSLEVVLHHIISYHIISYHIVSYHITAFFIILPFILFPVSSRCLRYASVTDSFLQSFGAIIVSEIGDKTFFIAALLAMKSSPHIVFAGAIGALAFMTVLSVVLGYAAPLLLPREITHYAAVALFFFFGSVLNCFFSSFHPVFNPHTPNPCADALSALLPHTPNPCTDALSALLQVQALPRSA